MIKVARKAAIVKRAREFVERQRGLATVGGEVTILAASLALPTVQDGRTEGVVPSCVLCGAYHFSSKHKTSVIGKPN